MQITIHRGTQQIGGSVIELNQDGERILLDAGLPLDSPVSGLSEIPQTLDPHGLRAILVSHAHPDHYGLIESINECVPVYMTEGTSKALLASSLFAGTRSLVRERQQKVKPMQSFRIGPFKITAIPVDHSAFDAVAYSIQSEEKHILYTGDLRAHGRKPGMLRQLKAFCQATPVDLLISEGTRIKETGGTTLSEAGVESKLREIYAEAPGLVLNWFSPLNLDRWVSAFRTLGRRHYFVHDLYTEFLHYLIKAQVPAIPLEQESDRLRVFCPPNQSKKLAYKGIQKFIEKTKLQIQPDIQAAIDPTDKCVLLFRPSMLKLLFAGEFPPKTELIVSLWKGYAKSKDFEAIEAALHRCDGRIRYVHASGHIYPEDLIELIQTINPQKLIPVHTEHPQSFLETFPQTFLPKDGECHEV